VIVKPGGEKLKQRNAVDPGGDWTSKCREYGGDVCNDSGLSSLLSREGYGEPAFRTFVSTICTRLTPLA
jgi:hypothetical protein